jgi:hypothetical protein
VSRKPNTSPFNASFYMQCWLGYGNFASRPKIVEAPVGEVRWKANWRLRDTLEEMSTISV